MFRTHSLFQSKALTALILSFAALLPFQGVGAAHAADTTRILEAIDNSDLIPAYYRRHLTLTASGSTVSITVYRDPDSPPYDCQIDAILMAARVHESDPGCSALVVAFYQLNDPGSYFEVTVPISTVVAYGEHKLSREEVIRQASLKVLKGNQLAGSYGGLSYEQMIKDFGVVNGPLRNKRALTLARIEAVEGRGAYVGELRRDYVHMEDEARRGDAAVTRRLLDALSRDIDAKVGEFQGRTDKLKALRDDSFN